MTRLPKAVSSRRRPLRSVGLRSGTGRVLLAAGLLVGGVLPLAGCAGSSTTRTGRGPAGELMPIPDAAYAELGFRRDWKGFPFVTRGQRIQEVLLGDDLIFVRESGSGVSALDATNGEQRWSAILGTRLTKFVSLRRGIHRGRPVVFASAEADVFALDIKTGNQIDRQSYEKVVNAGPVVLGSTLIYGTSSGEVLAHTLLTGSKLWGHDLPGTITQDPILVGSAVGTISSDGDVVFLDAARGSLWARTQIFGNAGSDPVAAGNLFVVASVDQSLWAFEPQTGRVVWRKRTAAPITSQPVVHNGVVYCSIPGQGLTAFEASTGREIWSNPEVEGRAVGLRAGQLIVWGQPYAYAVSPVNGTVATRVEIPAVSQLKMDSFEEGNLYAVDPRGAVARFVPAR